jgi:hypothetical protein
MRPLLQHSTGDRPARRRACRLEFFRDDDNAWHWQRRDDTGQLLERSERTYADLPDAIQDAYGGAKGAQPPVKTRSIRSIPSLPRSASSRSRH